MNSIASCENILDQLGKNENKRDEIMRETSEYQQRCESEQQTEEKDLQEQQLLYQGFQNKRSLKIKPINMFKDIISLRKENHEKRQQVKNMENINEQLKQEYDQCMNQNLKLEHFLKEVEFTFQPDRKMTQASDVLLRARRNLFQESKETKDRIKKMFRNSDASTVQELKAYISVLENQRQRLRTKILIKKQQANKRVKEQDFNIGQAKKYQLVCEKVKQILTNEVQKTKERTEAYKVQRMQVKQQLKMHLLESKKKIVKNQADSVKRLLLETQGLEYEIGLLKHRLKDRKKQKGEYESLLQKLSLKQGTILKLQRQLREKNKTFDYMLAWTKQLKKQLEDRKSGHLKKKELLEDQINTFSEKYQEYNQIYKTGLFEEQVAKRRGPRDADPPNIVRFHPLGKQITIGEIKSVVRSLSFYLLQQDINTEAFIDTILIISEITVPRTMKKIHFRQTLDINDGHQASKDIISLRQLTSNLEKIPFLQNHRQQIQKIARFIVEDGSTKAEESTGVFIGYARQIIRNLLKRELISLESITQTQQGFKKLIQKSCQPLRQELKVLGGCAEEIQIETMKLILPKYGLSPYLANLIGEYFQFYGWKKRKEIGYTKLEDYNELVHQFLNKIDNDVAFN